MKTITLEQLHKLQRIASTGEHPVVALAGVVVYADKSCGLVFDAHTENLSLVLEALAIVEVQVRGEMAKRAEAARPKLVVVDDVTVIPTT